MAIVSVVQTKGGVGKTTTALQLATGLQLAGYDVLAVDADTQASLAVALANRPEDRRPVACTRLPDAKSLTQQVQLAAQKHDFLVIDVAGRDSNTLRRSAAMSDLVLVPVVPRAFDLWALDETLLALDDARSVKPDLPVFGFLTMADPRGSDNDGAIEMIPEGIEYAPIRIGRRKAIAEAAQFGMGILEVERGDEKAVFEVQCLIKFVLEKTTGTKPQ